MSEVTQRSAFRSPHEAEAATLGLNWKGDWIMRRGTTVLMTAIMLMVGTNATVALELKVTDADNSCPEGYTLLTYGEAKAH